MPRRDELRDQLRSLMIWARNNPTSTRNLTGSQIQIIFEAGKRVGHFRGYKDGHFDHGQSWGDRTDYREEEFIAGRDLDPNEDDNPLPVE